MLRPKRTKYRKPHRGRLKGRSSRGNFIAFGEYGLQAAQPRWIRSRQLEARRRVLTRYVRRGGLWIRVFPDKPVTMRAAETRMGSGKGSPEYWVAVVRPGQVLFELRGVSETSARRAIRIATSKLPIKTRFITKSSIIILPFQFWYLFNFYWYIINLISTSNESNIVSC